jgi:hypothetical protein
VVVIKVVKMHKVIIQMGRQVVLVRELAAGQAEELVVITTVLVELVSAAIKTLLMEIMDQTLS